MTFKYQNRNSHKNDVRFFSYSYEFSLQFIRKYFTSLVENTTPTVEDKGVRAKQVSHPRNEK